MPQQLQMQKVEQLSLLPVSVCSVAWLLCKEMAGMLESEHGITDAVNTYNDNMIAKSFTKEYTKVSRLFHLFNPKNALDHGLHRLNRFTRK